MSHWPYCPNETHLAVLPRLACASRAGREVRDSQGWAGQGPQEPVCRVRMSGASLWVARQSQPMCCGCRGAGQHCSPLGGGKGNAGSPCSLHWRDLAFPFFSPSWSLQCQWAVVVGGEPSGGLQLGTDPSGELGNYGSALRQGNLGPATSPAGSGGGVMLQPQMRLAQGGPRPQLDKAVEVWQRHLCCF